MVEGHVVELVGARAVPSVHELVVGLRWRQFLLGRRSNRADLHNPIDLCQGALPLRHVCVEKSQYDEGACDGFWRDAVACPDKWYLSHF